MLAQLPWTNLTLGLSSGVALSAIALIGYLFGRSQRTRPQPEVDYKSHGEIQRAARIARQLEQIADDLRQDLALHRDQVERFKAELRRANGEPSDDAWRRLRDEAENMVAPTLELVSQLSSAYDKIRQQSRSLANFTGGRTDPLTGLANSRSLDEHLEVLLKSRCDGVGESTVVVVSLDAPIEDRAEQDRRLLRVGQQLSQGLRGQDFAARYGVDDFVVVLPATPMVGAAVFGARLRKNVESHLGLSVCCGLAESMPADTPKSLLARADSAAYSAKAAGSGSQYLHTGASIRADLQAAPVVPAEDRPEPAAAPEAPVAPIALAGPLVSGDIVSAPLH